MRLPKSPAALLGHHKPPAGVVDPGAELPAALRGARVRNGVIRLLCFAGIVVALIVAVPGLSSIRGRLAHGIPGWLLLAGCFRLSSALSYVVLFRAIFAPELSPRLVYQIGMSEIGLNALVPAGGAGGLAIGGWVLHRRGMPTARVLQRSAEFFVFTSAFNVGAVAVLGWLGAVGLLASHVSPVLSAVPALAATIAISLSLALAPRLVALQANQSTQRAHSRRWWLLEAAVALGTGVRGTVKLFRAHDPWAIAAGAGYLLFDIATLWAAVRAFHVHAALEPLAMAYLVGQLAGEIPIPGGLGVVEGGLIGALVLYGLPLTLATAGALAYRAIALGVPAVFGSLAAISLTRTIRSWGRNGEPAVSVNRP